MRLRTLSKGSCAARAPRGQWTSHLHQCFRDPELRVILQSELRSIQNGVEKLGWLHGVLPQCWQLRKLQKAMEEAKLIQTQMRRPRGPKTRKDRKLQSHLGDQKQRALVSVGNPSPAFCFFLTRKLRSPGAAVIQQGGAQTEDSASKCVRPKAFWFHFLMV